MHKYSNKVHKCLGLFTLPKIETEIDTDEMGTEPNPLKILHHERPLYLTV